MKIIDKNEFLKKDEMIGYNHFGVFFIKLIFNYLILKKLVNFDLDLNKQDVEPKYLTLLHPKFLDTKTGEVLISMNIYDKVTFDEIKTKNSDFNLL